MYRRSAQDTELRPPTVCTAPRTIAVSTRGGHLSLYTGVLLALDMVHETSAPRVVFADSNVVSGAIIVPEPGELCSRLSTSAELK